MFLTYCIESDIGLTAGKLMCGKKVAKSDSTYIHNAKLKKLFLQLQKMIRVTDVATYEAKSDRIEKLENTIEVLKKDLIGYKTAVEIGEKQLKELREEIEELKQRFGILEEFLKGKEEKAVSEGYHLEASIKSLKHMELKPKVLEYVRKFKNDAIDVYYEVTDDKIEVYGYQGKDGDYYVFKKSVSR